MEQKLTIVGIQLLSSFNNNMADNANYKLLHYTDLAMNPVSTQESAVDDFALHLLKLLGYVP